MSGTPERKGQIFGKTLERGVDGSLISSDGPYPTRMWNGPLSNPAWSEMPALNDHDAGRYQFLFEDFHVSPSALRWVSMDDGASGTDIHQDAAGGVMSLITTASNNDYKAYRTPRKFFKFIAGKEAAVEMRFKLTEAATNASAIWLQMSDTLTTGGMQTGASGPLANYCGATIWKDAATLNVNFECSNAGSQSTLASFATFGSGSWSRMAFYFDGVSKFTPFFSLDDGVTWTIGAAQTIAPSLSGMTDMYLLYGVKAGGANVETLEIDFVKAQQLR